MSAQAEESVLGAVLLEPGLAGDIANDLSGEMFTHPGRREIFEKISELFWLGKPIDVATLSHALPEYREYLVSLAQTVPSISHLADYIRIVQDDWQTAKLEDALMQIRCDHGTVEEMVDRLEELTAQNRKLLNGRQENGVTSFAEAYDKFRAWLEETDPKPRHTGYAQMDQFTGGCREGTMLLLAGRPGSGKTDFALNMALRLAKRGIQVIYFTMEMSDVDLIRRAVAHVLKINGSRIRDRQLTQEELAAVKAMNQEMAQWRMLSFVYEGGLGINGIRRRVELYRPQVIIVDHIGLLKRPKAANAYQEIGILSRQLHQMALDEKICVVALSQMNRQIESRANKEPNLGDLRESGDLEQDSDFIGFIQPQIENGMRLTGDDSMDSFLWVKKAREGQMEGKILYHWQPQYHRFSEVDTRY